MLHDSRKSLAEHGDKLQVADKTAIENALAELERAISGDDAGQIEAKSRALTQASSKLGEAASKSAQDQTGGGSTQSETSGRRPADDDVVDAEFEEVDERRRASR